MEREHAGPVTNIMSHRSTQHYFCERRGGVPSYVGYSFFRPRVSVPIETLELVFPKSLISMVGSSKYEIIEIALP